MESTSEKGVAAVVGVGSGLGAALARRFAVNYKVALIARSAAVTEQVANEIRAAGGIAVPIQSDATLEGQIAATHEQIRRELGPIEILIYNGGRRPMARLMETTPEVFEQTWRLHTFGAFLWARHPAVAQLRGVRASQVCRAGSRAGDGARSSSAGNPRRIHQRGRRHRHATAEEITPGREGRRFAQTVGDR
jgi:NAD(P)-dependent dehydrogenase (short-subunit alcohol dehydrogenase family)